MRRTFQLFTIPRSLLTLHSLAIARDAATGRRYLRHHGRIAVKSSMTSHEGNGYNASGIGLSILPSGHRNRFAVHSAFASGPAVASIRPSNGSMTLRVGSLEFVSTDPCVRIRQAFDRIIVRLSGVTITCYIRFGLRIPQNIRLIEKSRSVSKVSLYIGRRSVEPRAAHFASEPLRCVVFPFARLRCSSM